MKKLYLVLILAMCVITSINAQPGFDDDVDDVAPIPGIALAIAAAITIGFVKVRRNR